MQNTLNSGMGSASNKEREAQARQSGFKSAAEMDAFYANRARMNKRSGSKPGTKGMGAVSEKEKPAPKKPSGNPLTRLLDGLNGKSK